MTLVAACVRFVGAVSGILSCVLLVGVGLGLWSVSGVYAQLLEGRIPLLQLTVAYHDTTCWILLRLVLF